MAGIVTIAVTFPIDIIKCKMQVDNLKNPLYHNIKECFHETVSHAGYKGLYKGFSISLTRAPLTSFVTFYVFDKVSNKMKYL